MIRFAAQVEVGHGFWRPRHPYKVTITAGMVEPGKLATKAPPKGSAEYTFHLFDGEECSRGGSALHFAVGSMALREVRCPVA